MEPLFLKQPDQPKLVILTLDFAPQTGGVQTFLWEIAKRLAEIWEVVVLTPVAGDTGRFRRIVAFPSQFVSYLRRLQPDHVLVGHAHPKLLLSAALTKWGKYSVLTHGNDFIAAQRHWHRPIFNYLLRQARPLFTNSNANAQRLKKLGLASPITIHPGTDPRYFQPSQGYDDSHLSLLTVGRLVPRKGIDLTLSIMPALLEQFPMLHYDIGGTGPDQARLEQLVQDLEITRAVRFLGHIPNEDIARTYRQASIFVMPSREILTEGSVEGFGIVYLEASASGLPVVASKSGGAVEAVRDGETGFLVPPDDPDALLQVLRRLLADKALRRELGQNGRHWVETEMNWDRAARQMQIALDLL